MLSNFGRKMTVSHLANCLNADDAPAEFFTLKTFLEFVFCFTGAEYLNRFCITNTCDDVIIVFAELVRELPVSRVLRRASWDEPPENRTCFSMSDFISLCFLPFVWEDHNNSLPMVNPQTHFSFHRFPLCP
jgi:hypothetical protein